MCEISVIIPTYNDERTLSKCIESVLCQSLPATEIIIVDDGSTDGTADILKKYEDRESFVVIHQENAGRNQARMRGFKSSSCQYLLFLDSDIVMKQNMLEQLCKALKDNPDASYAYSGFIWGFKKFKSRNFDGQALKKVNYIHTSSLIRRDDFPGFDQAILRFQDWDLWLTMLENSKVGVFVPKILCKAYVDRESLSKWLPKYAYFLPWNLIGWRPERVRNYEESKKIIQNKHKLE